MIIILIRKATMGKDNIILTEVKDIDVDMNFIMFLVFPIHFLYNAFNKLL